jgi:hypothetical protein
MKKQYFEVKVFGILLVLSLVSVMAVFPYVLTLQGDLLKSINQPIGLIVAAQVIQSLILFSGAIFFGLKLAKNTNFRLPLLEAVALGGDYKKIIRSIGKESVIWGIVTALAIYILDFMFTALGANISTHQNLAPVWQKLLAAIYGGVTEEILMRLFLMSLLVWLGKKLFRQTQPTSANIMASILLAAVVFGLGHLPVTAALTKITPLVVGRAVVLNGVGGIVFGWLYWKKGLESAMLAHLVADVFLLTLLPMLG